MKRTHLTHAVAAITAGVLAVVTTLAIPGDEQQSVAFSPAGFGPRSGCAALAESAIAQAKKSIRVQAYGFSNDSIAQALMDAYRRGVDVQIILDRSNLTADESKAAECQTAGIKVFIDSNHPIAHNKIIIIDGQWVLQGSWNLTGQAEKNAENLLLTKNAKLAEIYAANWAAHLQHSSPYKP